jgi:hypothetical protein
VHHKPRGTARGVNARVKKSSFCSDHQNGVRATPAQSECTSIVGSFKSKRKWTDSQQVKTLNFPEATAFKSS